MLRAETLNLYPRMLTISCFTGLLVLLLLHLNSLGTSPKYMYLHFKDLETVHLVHKQSLCLRSL